MSSYTTLGAKVVLFFALIWEPIRAALLCQHPLLVQRLRLAAGCKQRWLCLCCQSRIWRESLGYCSWWALLPNFLDFTNWICWPWHQDWSVDLFHYNIFPNGFQAHGLAWLIPHCKSMSFHCPALCHIRAILTGTAVFIKSQCACQAKHGVLNGHRISTGCNLQDLYLHSHADAMMVVCVTASVGLLNCRTWWVFGRGYVWICHRWRTDVRCHQCKIRSVSLFIHFLTSLVHLRTLTCFATCAGWSVYCR